MRFSGAKIKQWINIRLARSKRHEKNLQIAEKNNFRLSRMAQNIFNFQKQRSRAEWIRFSVFMIFLLYFLGLIVVVALAYRRPAGEEATENNTISRRDDILKNAAIVYPIPAAIVNDDIITLRQFYQQVDYLKHYNEQVPNSLTPEIKDEVSLYKRVLETLIDNRLIRQEAKKHKISVTNKDVDTAYESITKENGGADQVEKVLRRLYDMSPNEFKALIRDQILKEKMIKTLLVQVKVRHILVSDENKANQALARLQKGESFDEVAKSMSQDTTTKNQGGDLGWLGRQDLRTKIAPEFEQAAMALAKNQLSAPVKTKFGFHIIRLDDKKGTVDKAYDDWFKEIKNKAKIIRFIRT